MAQNNKYKNRKKKKGHSKSHNSQRYDNNRDERYIDDNENMSDEESYEYDEDRRRRRRSKKSSKITKFRSPIRVNLGVVVFLVIFAYIVILIVSYFKAEHITPYEVKNGSLAVNNTYDGVILREEQVVTSDFSGYINYYTREGEKVSAYSMVYTVDSSGKLADMVSDNSEEDSEISIESLREVRSRISDFAVDFNPRYFNETYNFKYGIEGTVLKMANSNVLANIDKLRAENYSDSIDFGYSPASGVVVYSVDGYEDVTADTIMPEQFSREDYAKEQLNSNELIDQGDAAYKLITSELWSVLIEVDEDKATSLATKSYIEVRFLKNNYKSWAAVSILRQNGKTYAKLDFNNSMITFALDRFVEIELLDNAEEGLKIPKSAIVTRTFYLIPEEYLATGGNTGTLGFYKQTYTEDGTPTSEFVPVTVYNKDENNNYYVEQSALDKSTRIIKPESDEIFSIGDTAKLTGVYNINKGYADFKQIEIKCENEEYAIVKSQSDYGLSAYDHIVLKGDTVNDKDLIYE